MGCELSFLTIYSEPWYVLFVSMVWIRDKYFMTPTPGLSDTARTLCELGLADLDKH